MSKIPNQTNQEIRPGAVLGSDNLPFESMIFSNDAEKTPSEAPSPSASRFVPRDPAQHLTEAPRPNFPKLFRPNS